ncbi:hypothetical protein CYQ88_00945 [Hydrogenovibrio sp. SC-1]|uniref:type II secretion system protein N n=1 Tax=Hydrogenovibrio sp. SC-1 TaxID=2065820 RepID=UPI000C79ECB1|nr:type II secretion system protein N [Hydrogenovibrio sp. SC-1]PLA75564.1 hypothetical protein CYQ88_00945 [Hydrogenovibrio sp. SC-1]
MKRLLSFSDSTISMEHLSHLLTWLLGLTGAWLFGQLIASSLTVVPDYPVVKLDPKQTTAPLLKGQASGLFGYAPIETSKSTPPPDTKQVAKTKLNWTLQGVIVDANQAVAIIDANGQTKVVLENEWVMPQVRLVKVMANGVLLDNRGVAEKLLLKAGDQDLTTSEPVAMIQAQPLTGFDQQRLTEIGETLRKSPMSIGQFLRFQPINQKGQWVGVKIWSKNDKSLFKALGFKEGDMVKQVNGRSIQEMSKNPTLWKQFLTMSEFELVVDRQGEMKTLQVNFN